MESSPRVIPARTGIQKSWDYGRAAYFLPYLNPPLYDYMQRGGNLWNRLAVSFLREQESGSRGITGVLLIFSPTLTLPSTTICKGAGICESVIARVIIDFQNQFDI